MIAASVENNIAPHPAPPAVLVQGVAKSYGIIRKSKALEDISLTIQPGEIFALIGPNGAGKTTLMGCLLALLRPDRGQISIFGYPADHFEARRKTAYMPERPAFESYMHAREFLHYHYLLARQPKAQEKQRIEEVLEHVELTDVGKKRIAKFSRGMLQRLGLAQMMIGNPEICFLDEPTSGMDPLGMELVRRIMLVMQKQGSTIVVNSHHLDEVERICTNFAFIRNGRIEQQASVSSVSDKVMVVRFRADSAGGEEKIRQIVSDHNGRIKEFVLHTLRVELSSREEASQFLRAMVEAGLEVEECFFDKKALVELFRKESAP